MPRITYQHTFWARQATATCDDRLLILRLPKTVEAEQKETRGKIPKARAKKPKAIATESK